MEPTPGAKRRALGRGRRAPEEFETAYTDTFGEVGEAGVGTAQITRMGGRLPAGEGISIHELKVLQADAEGRGFSADIYDLNLLGGVESAEPAAVLVVRNGAAWLGVDAGDAYAEHEALEFDTKKKSRGKVKNALARHVTVFGETASDPDFEAGKGRVHAIDSVACIKTAIDSIGDKLPRLKNLVAEGNKYHDARAGIGPHGDTERRVVIAARYGRSIPLHYWWYKGFERISPAIDIHLDHGDVYMMSEKAVGTDWRRPTIMTLRHAAGAPKYTRR